jgi:hypothetical protein
MSAEKFIDPDVENALTLSEKLCGQFYGSAEVPAGDNRSKALEFLYTGRGFCNQARQGLAWGSRRGTIESCKQMVIERGGMAFSVLPGGRHWSQHCIMYEEYCVSPYKMGTKGYHHWKVYSLKPARIAYYGKFGGGFVGGSLNGAWNL